MFSKFPNNTEIHGVENESLPIISFPENNDMYSSRHFSMYVEITYMSGTILKHFTEVKSCNPHSNPLR